MITISYETFSGSFLMFCYLYLTKNVKHTLSVQGRKPMRWEFFMGYRCDSPNTCVMWTYPKSALTPISCLQTVACSINNDKPWECKNLMQVWVWHLQRAKTILYPHEIGNQKNGTFRQLLSHLYWVFKYIQLINRSCASLFYESYSGPSALQPQNLCCGRRVARGNWTHDHFGGVPLIIDILYTTPTILRLIRAGPPIPPMIVLKHGELR